MSWNHQLFSVCAKIKLFDRSFFFVKSIKAFIWWPIFLRRIYALGKCSPLLVFRSRSEGNDIYLGPETLLEHVYLFIDEWAYIYWKSIKTFTRADEENASIPSAAVSVVPSNQNNIALKLSGVSGNRSVSNDYPSKLLLIKVFDSLKDISTKDKNYGMLPIQFCHSWLAYVRSLPHFLIGHFPERSTSMSLNDALNWHR